MNKLVYEWMKVWMDKWMKGCMYVWMEGCFNGCMNVWMYEQMKEGGGTYWRMT